ncbi:hypothetical protein BYT27DRAFT_7214509 [Phlegmacium glaucopus]|nr:hypothetical protein BYT27DRAFT_7214509 [Phlegmacium glaucopus]
MTSERERVGVGAEYGQWITDAKALARKVWTENYKKTTPLPAVAEESRACEPNCFSAARRYFDALQDKFTSFDALEDWLVSPVINTLQDPIAYWSGMQAASHPLATMALNFLSIPGE